MAPTLAPSERNKLVNQRKLTTIASIRGLKGMVGSAPGMGSFTITWNNIKDDIWS
jgi:hypothetical protein